MADHLVTLIVSSTEELGEPGSWDWPGRLGAKVTLVSAFPLPSIGDLPEPPAAPVQAAPEPVEAPGTQTGPAERPALFTFEDDLDAPAGPATAEGVQPDIGQASPDASDAFAAHENTAALMREVGALGDDAAVPSYSLADEAPAPSGGTALEQAFALADEEPANAASYTDPAVTAELTGLTAATAGPVAAEPTADPAQLSDAERHQMAYTLFEELWTLTCTAAGPWEIVLLNAFGELTPGQMLDRLTSFLDVEKKVPSPAPRERAVALATRIRQLDPVTYGA